MWVLKVYISALSFVFVLVGVLTTVVGIFANSVFISLLGLYIVVVYTVHIISVTRPPDGRTGFERAFGFDWMKAILSEQMRYFLSKRTSFLLPSVPKARLEQNICFATFADTDRQFLCDIWQPSEGIRPSGVAYIYLHGSAFYFLDKDYGTPIDYKANDFVEEIYRLTGAGVDVVFDPIGGSHLWHSRKALHRGGKVVGYGLISSIRGNGMTSGRTGRRQRFLGIPLFLLYIVGSRLLPGRKHLIPYSIQTLKRLKPEFFRQDLMTLFDLLKQKKIQPLIAQRFPLAQARQAQELLAKGGIIGKIVLDANGLQ